MFNPLRVTCIINLFILFTNSHELDILQAKPCHVSVTLVSDGEQLNYMPFPHINSDCYSCKNYGAVAFEFIR
jgi:hypothetical protein